MFIKRDIVHPSSGLWFNKKEKYGLEALYVLIWTYQDMSLSEKGKVKDSVYCCAICVKRRREEIYIYILIPTCIHVCFCIQDSFETMDKNLITLVVSKKGNWVSGGRLKETCLLSFQYFLNFGPYECITHSKTKNNTDLSLILKNEHNTIFHFGKILKDGDTLPARIWHSLGRKETKFGIRSSCRKIYFLME